MEQANQSTESTAEQTPQAENEATEAKQASSKADEAKFTQADVDRIVSDRLSRERPKLRSQLEADVRKQLETEQNEAQKLNDMTKLERLKYEKQKSESELEQLRQKVNRQEMERTAMKVLAEKGVHVNDEVLSFVVGKDAEATKAKIDSFVNVIGQEVKSQRKEQFASQKTPTTKGGKQITSKDFAKMTYTERLTLKQNQPAVYQNLVNNSRG